jgi:hypothetical protein
MRKNFAILSILAASLMSYAAMARDEAARAPEGAAPAPDAAAPKAAPTPAAAPAGYPDEYALRPLVVASGMFQGTLPIVLNLSKGNVLKPVWIPLDLRWGKTNQLEFFVSHGTPGGSVTSGAGICLGGTSRNCDEVYNNVNFGGQYSFLNASGLELAGLLAAQFRELSPDMRFAVDVGLGMKYVAAPFSVKLTPQLGIGLNKRSSRANKEELAAPLQLALQAAPRIAVFLDSGISGKISHFGDSYAVPIGIGGSYLVMHGLDVGLEFMLPMLVKATTFAGGATDTRVLTLFVSWRELPR